jgi:hypothetical protein
MPEKRLSLAIYEWQCPLLLHRESPSRQARAVEASFALALDLRHGTSSGGKLTTCSQYSKGQSSYTWMPRTLGVNTVPGLLAFNP